MDQYRAMPGLHVVIMGAKGAAAYVRHAHNIPLGVGHWKPYRVIVTSHGGTLPHTAFYTVREFKAWLNRQGCTVRLQPHHGYAWCGRPPAWVMRAGRVELARSDVQRCQDELIAARLAHLDKDIHL